MKTGAKRIRKNVTNLLIASTTCVDANWALLATGRFAQVRRSANGTIWEKKCDSENVLSELLPVVTITDCVLNATLCDPNAECVERHCQCRIGYLGNGILCKPDPDDCHLNISLCGPDSRCVARRCKCAEGKICKFFDCATSPELCHPDADCNGKLCRCKQGFEGNGIFCKSLSESSTSSAITSKPSESQLTPEHLGSATASTSRQSIVESGSTHSEQGLSSTSLPTRSTGNYGATSSEPSFVTGLSGNDNCENFPSESRFRKRTEKL